MRRFPQQPLHEPIIPVNGHTYRLVGDWLYEDDKYKIFVKDGYLYDCASVLQLTTSFSGIYPDGLIRAAATVHDPIYQNSGYDTATRPNDFYEIVYKDGRNWISNREADKLFYKIYRATGEDREKCIAAYLAVRAGGFYPDDRVSANEVEYND